MLINYYRIVIPRWFDARVYKNGGVEDVSMDLDSLEPGVAKGIRKAILEGRQRLENNPNLLKTQVTDAYLI
jgi:hypothetical protein